MQNILLVRPGVTDYDRQGRIQGTLDVPLTEAGRRQIEEAALAIAALEPTAVYSSPSESSRETAAMIARALDLKPKTLDKLTNLDHGLWQGMLIEDVRSKQPKVYRQWREQPETVCPPGGETVLAAMQRVAVVLKKLLKKHKERDTIALVAPEPLASVVRHVIKQDSLGDLWKSSAGCGQWESIEVPPQMAGVS